MTSLPDCENVLHTQSPNTEIEKKSDCSAPSPSQERPFSIFTTAGKWFIVALISFIGLFSPLTSSIYLPAIPLLTKVFNKSTELINLTVTIYIVMQGIAPMLWGPLSDRIGRRPMFSICLIILSLTCVGLALTPTHAYWLLMLLRCLQAAGSASTIAIGAGVIGDISAPEERGGFLGFFLLGPMIGPSIGPIIGGALAEKLGWRSIFWFLCISSSFCLAVLLLLLPETLRSLVGDGSVIPSRLYLPIIPLLHKQTESHPESIAPKKASLNPFRLLLNPDIDLLLALNGLVCAIFYGYSATTSTLFVETYHYLNQTTLGLCFLAIGGGAAIGTAVHGKFLDWDYRRVSGEDGSAKRDSNFPVEKARLRILPFFIVVLVACCVGYGWCIQRRVVIAVPLIIQFIVGYIVIAVWNSTQTLMIDLFPGYSSSLTACSNLVRCSLSAFLVSVMDLMIRRLGVQWTFVLLGGLSALVLPLLYLEMFIGPRCRHKREIASSGSQ